MKRLSPSRFFLACFLLQVFEDSETAQNVHRGPEHCEVRYVKHQRVFLDVSPIAIQTVLDALYCTFLCTDNERCLSFNVKQASGAELECRLLATDKYSAAPHLLKSSQEFDHYSMRVRAKKRLDTLPVDPFLESAFHGLKFYCFQLTCFFLTELQYSFEVRQTGTDGKYIIVATIFPESL